MGSDLTTPLDAEEKPANASAIDSGSSYQISLQPVLVTLPTDLADSDFPQLPRSYGTESLSLLARDPHTIFAFWDIDWSATFRVLPPKERKVHLRLLSSDGHEEKVVEVEPMAGSCYVTVAEAGATYAGEIGYYHPTTNWNCLANSHLITTPTDVPSVETEADFATVPFHLSFQRMVDLLQETQRENGTLTAMLSDLRKRVSADETKASLSSEQGKLARAIEDIASSPISSGAMGSSGSRLRQKLEKISWFGSSSPSGAFGGSSLQESGI